MTRYLFALLAIFALSSLADAGVEPGSRWRNIHGQTVTFQGRTLPQANQTQTYVQDEHGTSTTAEGTPTPGGCSGETTEGGPMTSSDGNGNANRYRAKNGKLQQQRPNGTWRTLSKQRGTIQPTSAPGGDECVGGGGAPNPVIPPPQTLPGGGDSIGSHPGRTQ